MTYIHIKRPFHGLATALLASSLAAGCGGGGGDVVSPVAAITSLGGTAAVGSPIVGAALNVVCANGAPLSTFTSGTGSWSVNTTGATFPCAVQAQGGTVGGTANAVSYHAVALNPCVANVTPLTDLIVANLAGFTVPTAWFAGVVAAPARLTALTPAKADTALANVRSAFGTVFGNSPPPVTVAFTPVLGNAMDDVLAAFAKTLMNTGVSYSTLLAASGAAAGVGFSSPVGFNAALGEAHWRIVFGDMPIIPVTPIIPVNPVGPPVVAPPISVAPIVRTGTFTATGALLGARNSHVSVLLPNRKVLVSGGFGASSLAIASSESYDPTTAVWTTAAAMNTARSSPTATLLRNGKVLVSGGQTRLAQPTSIASAELYDPASNSWTTVTPLTTGRSVHTATLLPSGKVLVVGGLNTSASASSIAVAELFDPATNTWSPAGSLANARYAHTATLLSNGKVLIAGGLAATGTLAASELYDPASNTWSAASPMGTSRYLHTASTLPNGKILVTGGSSIDAGGFTTRRTAELYDPVAGTWTATAQMAVARSSHTETVLPEGKVLISGGFSMFASAELYDIATNTWTSVEPMTAGRHAHTATLLPFGRVLMTGGVSALANGVELF